VKNTSTLEDSRAHTDNASTGSRGPAVLDDFVSSYGYKFSDAAGYQWPQAGNEPNKL